MTDTDSAAANPHYSIEVNEPWLNINLSGDWTNDELFPDSLEGEIRQVFEQQPQANLDCVYVDMSAVSAWDSALLTIILTLTDLCDQQQVAFDSSQLPIEMSRLLLVASTVPTREVKQPSVQNHSFLHNVGTNAINAVNEVGEVMAFLNKAGAAFVKMLKGKASYRHSDTWLIMQQTGAEAMPIVSLLNFLVGAILGYIGVMQLQKFGAEIFIGDMVGVAITREIGAIITAIIMAGRSGAAFAAQLGTMKVNDEIAALHSMGLSPMEFLVLPRMIGMMLMMPLLAIYGIFMGIFGGAIVAYMVMGISLDQYFAVVTNSVGLNDVGAGLFMSMVFGAIVAVIGCQKGMSCGDSAEAVGASTTSAVVTATVVIFVAAAILTIVYGVLGV